MLTARSAASVRCPIRDSLFGSAKRLSESTPASKHVEPARSSYTTSAMKSFCIVFRRAEQYKVC
jgi:hypothetical protein